MPIITITEVKQVLDALARFIRQRPRVDPNNYGTCTLAYHDDMREIRRIADAL
jgi:hypothetical protein